MRRKRAVDPTPTVPLAPMIDCVFLLLVYFMTASTLEKQEMDIAFRLPGLGAAVDDLQLPEEQTVEIDRDGVPRVNGFASDPPEAPVYARLIRILESFAATGRAAGSEVAVTIQPHPETPHQAVIKVMDACARAGIRQVQFALSGEDPGW